MGLHEVTPLVLTVLVGAAFLAGWVDAVVGGGGLIQLPSLLVGLPASTPVATVSGTNKISSFAGTLVASATFIRSVAVGWPSALTIMVSAYAGSTAGARIVQYLPRRWFTPLILVVLIGVGVFMWRRPALGLRDEVRHHGAGRLWRLGAIGLTIGVYDGAVGPGTGTFFVIALVALIGYGFLEASALAKLANLATNLGAIVVFAVHRRILWAVGLPMAAANLLGGFIGARMAIRHGSGFVRRIFFLTVIALGVKLAIDTVRMF